MKIGDIIKIKGKKYWIYKINKKKVKCREVTALRKKGSIVSVTFGDRYEFDNPNKSTTP